MMSLIEFFFFSSVLVNQPTVNSLGDQQGEGGCGFSCWNW